MFVNVFIYFVVCLIYIVDKTYSSEPYSSSLRYGGGVCFEIPPWQHMPVEVDEHLARMKTEYGKSDTKRRQIKREKVSLVNSYVNRYMDTVIAPFLDTYHRNVQNSFHQLTNKLLSKIKDEIAAAVTTKRVMSNELTQLADSLHLPAFCDEERRAIRTLSSKHVADVYHCTEQAKTSIAKMGKYADETISITKSHMESILSDAAKNYKKDKAPPTNDTECLRVLAKTAVSLGYELDLSLTNSRRHNEQSSERLVSCSHKAKKNADEALQQLKELLYQCVYS